MGFWASGGIGIRVGLKIRVICGFESHLAYTNRRMRMETYVIVEWPHSQEYMDHPESRLTDNSGYFVPMVDVAKDFDFPEILIKWRKLGGHIHCKLFTRQPPGETWARCGLLTFSEKEWPGVQERFEAGGASFRHEGE